MAVAANFGRANRQVISWGVRETFGAVIGEAPINLLYDVSHNLAKLETHDVDGHPRQLCVHRKGATRALPARTYGSPSRVGQPVLVPGLWGRRPTCSSAKLGTRHSLPLATEPAGP
jgi:tRNA-splicing ligase RtcB (3'-phosphate/5'-hydroxy nucleic acid ligase)